MESEQVKTEADLANEAYFAGLIIAAKSAQAKAEHEAYNSPEAFAARLEAEAKKAAGARKKAD